MTKKEELSYSVVLFAATLLFLYSFINPNIMVIGAGFLSALVAFRLYRKKYPRTSKNYQDLLEERRKTKN